MIETAHLRKVFSFAPLLPCSLNLVLTFDLESITSEGFNVYLLLTGEPLKALIPKTWHVAFAFAPLPAVFVIVLPSTTNDHLRH